MIDKYKINRMVEYMKSSGFNFEVFEVVENLDQILSYYGLIDIELKEDEYLFLMAELLPLAEEFEFREAEYLSLQENPLIKGITERTLNSKAQAAGRENPSQSGFSTDDFMHMLAFA